MKIKKIFVDDSPTNYYETFFEYYKLFMNCGDCDPAFPSLNYICDRFELTLEQRFWLAFLYGTNYCAPTVYYIYNEFPDFENVSISRINKWWKDNKHKTVFQTDRAKVKNFDLFSTIVESYINLVGSCQEDAIKQNDTYKKLYDFSSKIYYFGRFSIFNYTQALWELTNERLEPTFFDLKKAESCRNGLCYIVGKDEYVTGNKSKINYKMLDGKLEKLTNGLTKAFPKIPVNLWNIETALCAFKKLILGKRYLGYYIDRQQDEILFLERNVTKGVSWKPLWDFRKEFFCPSLLGELNGWNGVRASKMKLFSSVKSFGNTRNYKKYKRKIIFKGSGTCYEKI